MREHHSPAWVVPVAVACPLYSTFEYLPPQSVELQSITEGMGVEVPFGADKRKGIVMGPAQPATLPGKRLRRIDRILDFEPVLSAKQLALAEWMSRYYHHPVGDTCFSMLPGLWHAASRKTVLTAQYWTITPEGRAALLEGELKAAPAQCQILEILAHCDQNPTPIETLNAAHKDARRLVRLLDKKGWVAAFEAEGQSREDPVGGPVLSDEQQSAVTQIQSYGDSFGVFLLEGVTGSGKTEIYLRMAHEMIRHNRQILVLVPEIALIPQMETWFRTRFGIEPVTYHSGLTPAQRVRQWRRCRAGEGNILIGTRSAIFLPLHRPGMLVIDEEHDSSYKQDDGLRYHARDVAIWRARQLNIPIILGSATPSLITLFNARTQRYRHLMLKHRAGNARLPSIHLIDQRRERIQACFSTSLLERIDHCLGKNAKAMLFINQRGVAPLLRCPKCSWLAQCRHCDAPMVVHKGSGQGQSQLLCHHCAYQQPLPQRCPQCLHQPLSQLGHGTQRIEESLHHLYPEVSVIRFDRDKFQNRASHLEALLAEIRAPGRQILVGTQMIAKGHDFPHVNLVAVVDADQRLFSPDFTARENLAQLLIQVSGRAGRGQLPGEVYLQTHYPEHEFFTRLLKDGYSAWAGDELEQRRVAQLPPYTYLAMLRCNSLQQPKAMDFLRQVYEQTLKTASEHQVDLWGPVVSPMERKAGRYRAQLLCQAAKREKLQHFLFYLTSVLVSIKSGADLRWSIDVDPVSLD